MGSSKNKIFMIGLSIERDHLENKSQMLDLLIRESPREERADLLHQKTKLEEYKHSIDVHLRKWAYAQLEKIEDAPQDLFTKIKN